MGQSAINLFIQKYNIRDAVVKGKLRSGSSRQITNQLPQFRLRWVVISRKHLRVAITDP
jgi:hypothetical protein